MQGSYNMQNAPDAAVDERCRKAMPIVLQDACSIGL